CQTKSTSIAFASSCAWARKLPSGLASKRNNTAAAFTLVRLPDAVSTCKEVPLSASTVPTLKSPCSSNRTFMQAAGVGNSGQATRTRGEARFYQSLPCAQACTPAAAPDAAGAGSFPSEVDHGVEVAAEIGEAVIAAGMDDLART